MKARYQGRNTEYAVRRRSPELRTPSLILILLLIGIGPLVTPAAEPSPFELPYVYTQWEQFTTSNGLPNDHIFAVRAAGDKVWVGTENGLACYDKRTRTFKSWTEKDGLPWRVVSALDVNPKTGEVWVGMFGGGLARFRHGGKCGSRGLPTSSLAPRADQHVPAAG